MEYDQRNVHYPSSSAMVETRRGSVIESPVMVRFAHGSGRQALRFGHVCAPAIHPIASFPIVLDWLLHDLPRACNRQQSYIHKVQKGTERTLRNGDQPGAIQTQLCRTQNRSERRQKVVQPSE
jgi:hypothetical protein